MLLEAADPGVPLLERLKFLMIYQSNLEEFYRVRIGILTHRALLTPDTPDPLTLMLPEAQINDALRITREQQSLMESIWKSMRDELHSYNVDVLDFRKISKVDELMSKSSSAISAICSSRKSSGPTSHCLSCGAANQILLPSSAGERR